MYDLLQGVRVLEVSLLAPAAVGQQLADLGADVVKVEEPGRGDYVREIGRSFLDGVSLMHLRWNRGKRSVVLDLKTDEGKARFRELARSSDVVIEGLRPGTLDRLGLGYADLAASHPALVYCVVSGLGREGPYRRLPSHGLLYDAYAGLAPPEYPEEDGIPRAPDEYRPIGIVATGAYGALGIVAALLRARATGRGALIEVAQVDVACVWQGPDIETALNPVVVEEEKRSLRTSVRYSYYSTSDDKVILFQATEAKFWDNFAHAVGRPDLLERFPSAPVGDHASGNEELRRELQGIFRTRTQREWVEVFLDRNIPGGPVNTGEGLPDDPHFRSRRLLYEMRTRDGQVRTMFGTPIKVEGQDFSADPAPALGEHTDELLRELG